MVAPDYNKLRGTEFERESDNMIQRKRTKAKNIVKDDATTKKPTSKKPPTKYWKEKLDDDKSPVNFTCIDWVNYFMYKCSYYGFKYYRGQKGAIINENKTIVRLMEEFEPQELKNIIDFMWDVWDNPKIDKRTLKITIFNTGWMQEIVNLAEAWSKGEHCSTKPKSTAPQREWRTEEPVKVESAEKMTKKQSRIFV